MEEIYVKPPKIHSLVHYEPSVLDGFCYSFFAVSTDGGSDLVAYDRDITMLLDDKKLSNPSLQSVISSLVSSARASQPDAFKGYSDDALMAVIKSRYIQSPCEVQSWSLWLKDNLQSIVDNLPPEPEPAPEPESAPEPPANS